MKTFWGAALILPLLALTACEEETPADVSTETGGQAAGEILGGTISDDMIPLEELTSSSPLAERSATTSTTTVTEDEDGGTTVETVTTTTSGDSEAPTPAPPEQPAAPE